MSKETKFKYFLDGKEVTKEAIDWTRSISIKPIKNSDEVHVTYMNYSPHTCGMSTRHKACNAGYSKNSTEVSPTNIFLEALGILPMDNSGTLNANEFLSVSLDTRPAINEVLQKAYNESTAPLGVKYNKHKAPLDIVQTRQFPKALQLLALATAYGNKKYEATDKDFLNFKRVLGGSQTYFDAAARHSTDRFGEDVESGLPHIIHAVWDNMAALEIWAEENKIDLEDFSKKYLENLHKSK